MTTEEMLFDVLSQMTPEQLKHQSPNVRSWYKNYTKLLLGKQQVEAGQSFKVQWPLS